MGLVAGADRDWDVEHVQLSLSCIYHVPALATPHPPVSVL
jgi:hypothetical protein